jgi:probable phosphoglycerate mutase
MKIYALRHGETQWNLEKRMQGHRDSPLTDTGIAQVRTAGELLSDKNITAVYSSDLGRAVQTAEIIISCLENKEIPHVKTPLLRELNLGSLEGQRIAEVRCYDPESFDAFWNHPDRDSRPDGESFTEIIQRAGRFCEYISTLNHVGDIAVVAHGVFMKALFSHVEKRELKDLWKGGPVRPAAVSVFELNDGVWSVVSSGVVNVSGEEDSAGSWFVSK